MDVGGLAAAAAAATALHIHIYICTYPPPLHRLDRVAALPLREAHPRQLGHQRVHPPALLRPVPLRLRPLLVVVVVFAFGWLGSRCCVRKGGLPPMPSRPRAPTPKPQNTHKRNRTRPRRRLGLVLPLPKPCRRRLDAQRALHRLPHPRRHEQAVVLPQPPPPLPVALPGLVYWFVVGWGV